MKDTIAVLADICAIGLFLIVYAYLLNSAYKGKQFVLFRALLVIGGFIVTFGISFML